MRPGTTDFLRFKKKILHGILKKKLLALLRFYRNKISYKRGWELALSLFALSLTKKKRFARKPDKRIPNSGFEEALLNCDLLFMFRTLILLKVN